MNKIRIFVIDESEIDIMHTRSVLARNPIIGDIFGFHNPVRAVKEIGNAMRVAKETPTILLVNISMQCISGRNLVQKLKSLPGVSDLPVILLTSSDTFLERIETTRLGVKYFISKPIVDEEISNLLRTIFVNNIGFTSQFTEGGRN